MSEILFVDVETSGLDGGVSGLLEIGAVWAAEEKGGLNYSRQCRLLLGDVVEEEALAVNGRSRESLMDAVLWPWTLALGEFVSWIRATRYDSGPLIMAGWNVHFDFGFLGECVRRAGLPYKDWPFGRRILDVHSLVVMHQLRTLKVEAGCVDKTNADDAAILLGLEVEYRALNGAIKAREMFHVLRGAQ